MTSPDGFSVSYGFDFDPVSIPREVFNSPQYRGRNESFVSISTPTCKICFGRDSTFLWIDSTSTLTRKIYFGRDTITANEDQYRCSDRSQTNTLDCGKSTVSSRRTVYRRVRDEDGPRPQFCVGYLGANRQRRLESGWKNGFEQTNRRNSGS